MKVSIERRALAETLKWVTSALAKNPATPAMNGVRITADADTLELTAWDYTAAHTARLPLTGAEPGEALIPGSALSYLVNSFKTKEVTIAVSGDIAEVTGGAATYRLRMLSLADFTAPPKPPKQIGSVSGRALAESVGATAWAAPGDDDPLASLVQVKLEAADSLLTLAATNRYVFGVDAITYSGDDFEAGVMPSMLVSAVSGLAHESEVGIGLDGSMLALIGSERTVALRLVIEPFPAGWRKNVYAPLPETCRVDAGDLADSLRRAASMAQKDDSVTLAFDAGSVTVSAWSETGDCTEVILAECSAPGEFGFSPRYLADTLKAVGGDVTIGYKVGDRATTVSVTSETLPNRITLTQSRKAVR